MNEKNYRETYLCVFSLIRNRFAILNIKGDLNN